MSKDHPDSAAIDRVGTSAIMAHFEITRQSVHQWRRAGVPKQHRKSLALLGESMKLEMPEMKLMRDRILEAG